MADTRRDNRDTESSRNTSLNTGQKGDQSRSDIERRPETKHELGRNEQRGITPRGDFDLFRDPFSMMSSFRREMDRLFDSFGLLGPRMLRDLNRGFGEIGSGMWSPQVEVFEREGKLHVSADLPGLSRDDVRVEMMDDALTIEGERRSEQKDEQGRWSERSYGRFFRTIPLPQGVNPDTAEATFENGVLSITFDAPQQQQRRGRQIEIGSGSETRRK